jgi:ribosomal protein S18 acetylase RimI-like enzyme
MDKLDVVIRRATAGDNVLLADMGARTFIEAYSADISLEKLAAHVASEYGPAEQAGELAEPSTLFLIAEVSGVAAGYAKLAEAEVPSVVRGERPVELNRIYLETQWIGRGVGARLMDACLEMAAAAGYKVMWLGVWEHNRRAIDFYHKWGFTEVGAHAFVLAGEEMKDILMERALE